MPLRYEAFIAAAIFVGSCHSWENARQNYPSRYKDNNLPFVPGCRVFEREDNLGLSVYCNSFDPYRTHLFLPNSTISLQIYGVYDLDVNRPLFSRLSTLKQLQLPGNRLKKFSSRILEGLSNLQSLDLSKNQITSLPDDTFIHNPLLEKLDVSQNFMISVEAVTNSLSELVYFRELKLAENLIFSSLSFSDFAPLRNTSFQSLDLSFCAIDRIDDNAFEPLEHLSVLDLSWTLLYTDGLLNITKSLRFSSLRRLVLKNLRQLASVPLEFTKSLSMTSVEEIDISFNRILKLPMEGNYPELKYLDMTACSLRDYELRASFFRASPKLQTLILKKNKFSEVRKFDNFAKLKYLDMSAQETDRNDDIIPSFKVADYSFENLVSLEFLSLEGNPLRQGIKRHTFYGLGKLINLKIGQCIIYFIEENAFETLHNLETLDLSFNNIADLDGYALYGLNNVKYMNLRQNLLTSLNGSSFSQHTPALESLILTNNKISQLYSGIFEGLFYLGVIKLDNNFIIPWHERVFLQNVSIDFLQLSTNRISYFSAAMLDDVRQVKVLNFAYNPLNCSVCGMKDLQSWMRNTSTEIKLLHQGYSEFSPYACLAPPQLENASILDVEIPIAHCIPKQLDVVFISLSTVIPFLTCLLISTLVWHFLSWHLRYCCFKIKSKVRSYKAVSKSDRYTYDAFISYCPSDLLWVRDHLMPALESDERGCRLCVPDRDFPAAVNITENVFDAVENSRTTILVLSNAYLESEWCKFDMDIAQHKLFEDTRSLILVLLEDVDSAKMTKNLKYIIKTRTFIPWTNNSVGQKLFWERLRKAVARPNEKVLAKHIT